jgi:DNA primase
MRGKLSRSVNYYKIIKNVDIIKELDKRGISGKISGKNLMINCQIHGERNPSFGINIENKKGICNCKSCGWTGNFFHLLSFLDDKPFEQIIKKYIKNDVDLKEVLELKNFFYSSLKKKNKSEINEIKYYNKKFLDKFPKPLGDYLDYLLEERKLNKKIIEKFNIRCCDGSGKGYAKIWKDRIVIPITDNKGLAGVTARYIYRCDKKNKVRKIKDSDISKVLFGLENIKKGSPLVLVEGEFDMIYLQMHYVPAVRSSKFPSKAMISKIMEYTDFVVLGLDGDVFWKNPNPKLQKDSIQYIKKELSKYLTVDTIRLPENKDPNDLSTEEVQKYFGKYINKNFFKKKLNNQ